jgi:hypothetical protein
MNLLAAAAAGKGQIPWAALAPIAVISIAFDAYCIADLVRHPRVRRFPRWAWALITLAVSPLGGIAFLLAGRSEER